MIKGIKSRFKELSSFYKKVKILLTTKIISLYKIEDEIEEQLGEEDSRWTKFCSELFEKHSIPDRIFKEILKRDYPIEEISLIWYEDQVSKEQMDFFIKSSTTLMDAGKEIAFIIDQKRWKRVEVYMLVN